LGIDSEVAWEILLSRSMDDVADEVSHAIGKIWRRNAEKGGG
jgi:hypothetical protein